MSGWTANVMGWVGFHKVDPCPSLGQCSIYSDVIAKSQDTMQAQHGLSFAQNSRHVNHRHT